MWNKLLHAVTNRNRFLFPEFIGNTPFTPDGNLLAADVRELLQLTDTANDYYIVGVLQAMYAYPEIARQLEDPLVSYDLSRYVPPTDSIAGATLLASGTYHPTIVVPPIGFPVHFETSLAWRTNDSALLTRGDVVETIKVRNVGLMLYPEWGDCGITGSLELDDDNEWEDGCLVSITSTPVTYPYSDVVPILINSRDVVLLLTQTGVSEMFSSAQSDLEKVALVGLALALSNKSVYP